MGKLQSKNGDEAPKSPSTAEAQYQYQRAFALSKDFREQLYYYSSDQLKQIEKQSVLVYVSRSTHFCPQLTYSRHLANVLRAPRTASAMRLLRLSLPFNLRYTA